MKSLFNGRKVAKVGILTLKEYGVVVKLSEVIRGARKAFGESVITVGKVEVDVVMEGFRGHEGRGKMMQEVEGAIC
jgi:hypothetical protein